MDDVAITPLLLAALALPVAAFLLLRAAFRVEGRLAAAIAVAAGWAANVAWAFDAASASAQADGDIVSIAAYFGWICPTALVALTWLGWRLVMRRAES